MFRALAITAIGLSLSGCLTPYPEIPEGAPAAFLAISRTNNAGFLQSEITTVYAYSDQDCENPQSGGYLTQMLDAKPVEVRIAAGAPIHVVGELFSQEGGSVFGCANMASFTPVDGAHYRLHHSGWTMECEMWLTDSTGWPPQDLIFSKPALACAPNVKDIAEDYRNKRPKEEVTSGSDASGSADAST